eukprot:743262_1
MWLKIITSFFFMIWGVAKAFGIRFGFQQDSLETSLKPNNADDDSDDEPVNPFRFVTNKPYQPTMEEMNHMINNAQVLQPTTNGEGELEDNQVTGNNYKKKDGNDSDTEMSQPDIVTVHLPAMKQSMYKPDPYKTLDYIMSGENVQEYENVHVVPSA